MYPEGEFKTGLQSRGKTKIYRRVFPFYKKNLIWSFHVAVVHGMTKKCPNRYNARAESFNFETFSLAVSDRRSEATEEREKSVLFSC